MPAMGPSATDPPLAGARAGVELVAARLARGDARATARSFGGPVRRTPVLTSNRPDPRAGEPKAP